VRNPVFPSLPVLLLAASLLAVSGSRQASATVNHGDFIGASVDFLQVSETTTTAGDPEPIWADAVNPVEIQGDHLMFAPSAFTSSCSSGGSDSTESVLTTTISAQPGGHIDNVTLVEAGDAILTTFPPFGNPGTNGSTALSGTVTVTATTGGPIAPVVIPFTGSFTPSGTFALPTNYGASNWTGSVSVDVASVVPLATEAVLSLTNTLDTNCAAGSTAATVQKKSVSGPTVAILVNPVLCDLQLDKTCCVTQPVLPDLGQCEGDMISMTLEYTGDSCSRTSNDQGRSCKCHGRRSLHEPVDITPLSWGGSVQVSPDTGIDIGDQVTFTSSNGTLPDKTKFKVQDEWWRKQYLKIDTSCERAFQCGDQFGAFKVTSFESTEGGLVDCNAPPPPPQCAGPGDPEGTPCDAKLVDMVLEYVGQDCQDPLANPQNGEAKCSGDATGATNVGITYASKFGSSVQISPSSLINDGDRIRVTSTRRGGLFPNMKLLITDGAGVRQKVEFHVSCSQPLALGDQFGSFRLVEFTTKSGTLVALGDGPEGPQDACEVPLAPPGPHCTSDLQELTLVYIGDFLGEGCTVSNPQGGYGTCSGVADPGDPVAVSLTGSLDAEPEDQIEFGDLVSVAVPGGGDLPWHVVLTATGAGGSQTVMIKTSCYKPLSLGDRFGAWVVFGMDREDDGPISLGGNVQYQYTVTNPGTDTVDNVMIHDDQLGDIATGVSLAPSESQTFVVPATLFGTTTNVATATGDVAGDVCDPGVDQVTVNVLAPPPGAFACSQPLSELSMIWNGAQPVRVKAWSGLPNSSTLIGTFEDVEPGDAITVDGLGAAGTTSVWEIFTTNGLTKLGESQFDLFCDDKNMNGVEDCGKSEGNSTYADNGWLINDWLLEGLVDSDETLSCTPGIVPAPPDCGFGPELVLLLPGLMWMHRRRLKKER
jgi:hypothetical protein